MVDQFYHENFNLHVNGLVSKKFVTGFSHFLFFVTKGLSKKFNKESHYHNIENDNKGGSNGGTEEQKEQE
ncbi:hypothetical protein MI410_10705 [Staphylococcus epidermidis]|uniref:hypothetical protein n=1 Tax=Staphylococcus epidermidis TaxID=1282 RepID=UPI00066B09BF|nr:hypothetical protein [Staphylococcus epidermidis]MCG7840165.1 hypothetical protein [Staphylococcus epidermidis]MCG7843612.1 hypothetical protein [Staphylococcus epidermidis]